MIPLLGFNPDYSGRHLPQPPTACHLKQCPFLALRCTANSLLDLKHTCQLGDKASLNKPGQYEEVTLTAVNFPDSKKKRNHLKAIPHCFPCRPLAMAMGSNL
jgi:hypothetical protein